MINKEIKKDEPGALQALYQSIIDGMADSIMVIDLID